ncbi:MAG: hypothetical protein AB7S93_14110 [Xanthobacteraceae bacterium]
MERAEIDLLKEHLPYELDMLDNAVCFMNSPEFAKLGESSDKLDQFKKNAAIESFWTHARNLIEFLSRDKSPDLNVSSASARDFAEGYRSNLDLESVSKKINEQVSHLGYRRVSLPPDKLSHEIHFVKSGLDSAFRRFQEQLNPECQEHWEQRQFEQAAVIVHANATATNTITIIGSSKMNE